MKFFTYLALPALFVGAFAAPAAVPETGVAVEKRQVADAYSIVEGLLSDVKQYTGAISQLRHQKHSIDQHLTSYRFHCHLSQYLTLSS